MIPSWASWFVFVSSHEIGHTLGLRHNMGSSSRTPVELLRNKSWVEANGHTASIMDYARFNYVAQPEDNISEKGLFARIGDYDKWAIKWGYSYSGTTDEDSDEKVTNKNGLLTVFPQTRAYGLEQKAIHLTHARKQKTLAIMP